MHERKLQTCSLYHGSSVKSATYVSKCAPTGVFGIWCRKIQNRSAPKFRADLLQKCEKTREKRRKTKKNGDRTISVFWSQSIFEIRTVRFFHRNGLLSVLMIEGNEDAVIISLYLYSPRYLRFFSIRMTVLMVHFFPRWGITP